MEDRNGRLARMWRLAAAAFAAHLVVVPPDEVIDEPRIQDLPLSVQG